MDAEIMARTIKAHKGNRNKRIEVRATVETVAQIAAIIAARGDAKFTVADWVAEKAREEFRLINQTMEEER